MRRSITAPVSVKHADLAFLLAQIDANILHGWPPPRCARERVCSQWGTVCHHVERGVSRFIPSILGVALGRVALAQEGEAIVRDWRVLKPACRPSPSSSRSTRSGTPPSGLWISPVLNINDAR